MAKKPNNSEIIVAEAKDQLKGSTPLKDARRERYCQEYLKDLIQTQAALRAGYAPISARNQASRLMAKDNIKDRIAYLQAEQAKRLEIEADSVVRELARIAFSNIDDYLTVDVDGNVFIKDFDTIDRDKLAAVESVKVNVTRNKDSSREYTTTQFKLHNKENALEQLGRHFGIFGPDNAQKAPDERRFTYIEAQRLFIEGNRLDAEIADISIGLAE